MSASKLIRITSDDANAIFDKALSEDLTIKENSSIALQSASFSRNSAEFSFHPDNMSIRFRSDVGAVTNTVADNILVRDFLQLFTAGRVVTSQNYHDFLRTLSASINASRNIFDDIIVAGRADVGVMANISSDNRNRTVIDIRKATPLNVTGGGDNIEHIMKFDNVEVTAGGLFQKRVTDPASTPDGIASSAYAYSKVPANKGGSYIRARVNTFNAMDAPNEWNDPPSPANNYLPTINPNYVEHQDDQTGFVLALVDEINLERVESPQFVPSRDAYAYVSLRNNTGRYIFGYGADAIDGRNGGDPRTQDQYARESTNFPLNDGSTYVAGDVVGIGLQKNQIIFFAERADGTVTPFLNRQNDPNQTRVLDQGLEYFWVIAMLGPSTKTTLNNIEILNDPFISQSTLLATTDFVEVATPQKLGAGPHQSTTAISPFLEFNFVSPGGVITPNQELQQFLGFSQGQSFDFTTTGLDSVLTGALSNHSIIGMETFLVVLDNIPLESFDTQVGGRKNVLSVIVRDKDIDSQGVIKHITHNENFLIYRKIKNNNEITLRQVRARILDRDLQPIAAQGLSSLTLLIKED